MQTTSARYKQLATGDVRPLSWQYRMSWDKSFDADVTFFTLDTSLLNGIDVLAPSDDNVIQEWDKYDYSDYTDRVINVEITKEESEPYSVTRAFADITLNNYDNYFTPFSESPIGEYILPRRPARILLGFGGENLPQFVGLTDSIPKLDKNSGTAKIHMVDFLTYIFEQDISETIALQNKNTSEILDVLFQQMGLIPSQYSLGTSTNIVEFFFVDKGTKFGDVVNQLVEAELASLYMNELGVITLSTFYERNDTPVMTFDSSNSINYETSDEGKIINSVKITSNILALQDEQSVWTAAETYDLLVGETIDVFVEFSDPVVSATDPAYSADQINESYFTSVIAESETAYTDVSFISKQVYSKFAILEFENVGASNATIKAIDLFGVPAKVDRKIIVEDSDAASITDFEEQTYSIDNQFIQSQEKAVGRAAMIINQYKDYGSVLDLQVKGNTGLQLRDVVEVNLDSYNSTYKIMKIVNTYDNSNFRQLLRVRIQAAINFFIISSDDDARSLLNGTDVLGL